MILALMEALRLTALIDVARAAGITERQTKAQIRERRRSLLRGPGCGMDVGLDDDDACIVTTEGTGCCWRVVVSRGAGDRREGDS